LIDGQRISFLASENNTSFVYYARVVGKGTFIAEQPIVQSMDMPGMRSFGKPETITIK